MEQNSREIAVSEQDALPYIASDLDIGIQEIQFPWAKDEHRDLLDECFIELTRQGEEEQLQDLDDRFKKLGRPVKDAQEKVAKLSVSLSQKIVSALKSLFPSKLTSQAVQEACWRYYLAEEQRKAQVLALKKELVHVAHLLESYDTSKKWDSQKHITVEMRARVKNFLRLVRFLGLIQKVPKAKTVLAIEDVFACHLDQREKRLYDFCQAWEINGYPDDLF